jgi:hypothetical protein
MDRGHFRAAYGRAGEAVASLDSTNSQAEFEAREVMAVALSRGIRAVAILPFWQTDAWELSAPTRFLDDLNDTIAYDYAEPGTPFVQLVGAGEIRRTLRLNRLDEQILDRRDARDAGRLLEVDYAIAGDGIRFVRSERTRREETRSAKMRGRAGADTSYVRRQFDIKIEARVEYRIVDVATGRTARDRTIEADITERYERSFFDGDWRDLDLSDRERRYFDRDEWAAEDDALALDLVGRLADKLTQQLYEDLLRLIE